MKNEKTISATLVILAMVVLSSCCGCKGSKSENPYKLNTHSWSAIEVDQTKITPEEDAYTITLDAETGKIFGRGDCNRYFGTYTETETRKLEIVNVGSTRMMCPNQTQEDNFFKALDDVDSYTIDGDILMLQNDGEAAIVFKAIPKISAEK